MAKGQVSEKELAASLSGLGSFGGMKSIGAKRDSPFGKRHAEKLEAKVASKTVEFPASKETQAEEVVVETFQAEVEEIIEVPEPQKLEVETYHAKIETTPVETSYTEVYQTEPLQKKRGRKPMTEEEKFLRKMKREEEKREAKEVESFTPQTETQYSERITVPMAADMRDDLEFLAKKLQRQRSSKQGGRITPNTLIRAFIQDGLDNFKVSSMDTPSGESEVLDLVKVKRMHLK